MSLSPVNEENLPGIKEKINRDPDLKDKLLQDLQEGLKSIGYYIPQESWDEMETNLRRIILDLKPLTEENLPELEEMTGSDPELKETLLEDLEGGLESIGYYLSGDLFDVMSGEIRKGIKNGVNAVKQEITGRVANEEDRQKISVKVKVSKGGGLK